MHVKVFLESFIDIEALSVGWVAVEILGRLR